MGYVDENLMLTIIGTVAKNIQSGKELYLNYGDQYWEDPDAEEDEAEHDDVEHGDGQHVPYEGSGI